jgi:steroid 5-alpha reductase family enzyme
VPGVVSTRQWLIRLLVTAWGLRLSLHILRRNWRLGEDFRYQRWRAEAGDATAWWGHYLVAAAGGAWWTSISPALMTFLLLRVSGVTMLESSLMEKKPGYQEYMESTSAFIPWIPRRAGRRNRE